MNKLIATLPLIALLIAGSAFYLAKSNNQLEAAVAISNNLSFFDWAKCYSNITASSNNCTNSDGYNTAAGRFANLTNSLSENIIAPCKNFTNYFLNATADQAVNLNSYFTNCFFNDQVLSIAQSDSCFYNNYFAPIYLTCTQTTLKSFFNNIKNEEGVNFAQLGGCQYNITSQAQQPCQSTDDYWAAAGKFNALTYPDFVANQTLSSACQNYYNYRGSALADSIVNKDGYYHDCFITNETQAIAQSNDCFNTYYYQPIFVKCAGF
ncbi:transmembrane protein, putative (macronuclear) [Tetrahymena thermophila SB210]|uniref:Transmembrane protein, putative n=1 Tax=Tetrahymena thermophila (strain SB210) TaxID=312017 RepID=Q22T58_TETTS|nr:transmembrane protein, putative [Tetrahymena thermophila SB210]EAR88580.1 transmembrane protein, putative [Tetrahymena thermophila SB210]|eukprot:XP_001008825.1 transmembrane protein, putative [Tetrahymena thermophila SB210]